MHWECLVFCWALAGFEKSCFSTSFAAHVIARCGAVVTDSPCAGQRPDGGRHYCCGGRRVLEPMQAPRQHPGPLHLCPTRHPARRVPPQRARQVSWNMTYCQSTGCWPDSADPSSILTGLRFIWVMLTAAPGAKEFTLSMAVCRFHLLSPRVISWPVQRPLLDAVQMHV